MRVGGPAIGTGAPFRVPHTDRQTGTLARRSEGSNRVMPCCLTQHEDMKKAAVAGAARGLLRLCYRAAKPVCRSTGES